MQVEELNSEESNEEPKSVEETLREIASGFKKLTDQIDEMDDSDLEQHKLLRQRTELVAKMPEMVRKALDFNSANPELLESLEVYGLMAERNLREGKEGRFGQRRLLIPQRHQIGEPNSLEQLISDYFPEQKAE